MLPLLLIAGGLVALAAGLLTLRSLGPGYRVGRLLATTRLVSVGDARRMAAGGERRFVAVAGRIDSDEEFEDAAHNPLVFRRTRIAARVGRRWTRFEDGVEVVPFEVRDGLDGIAVDTAAIGEGLVVMPRISEGVARDLGDRAPGSVPPDAPARVTIDQVSSVEHARVLGWAALAADGQPVMTAGDGRPLILSTLEGGEAMRVLAHGERLRPRLAAAAFVVAGALLLAGILAVAITAASTIGVIGVDGPPAALAANPTATAAATPIPSSLSGDTRSSGEGPGLVGAPGAAIVGVLLVGLLSAGATLLYVRATRGRVRP